MYARFLALEKNWGATLTGQVADMLSEGDFGGGYRSCRSSWRKTGMLLTLSRVPIVSEHLNSVSFHHCVLKTILCTYLST